MEQSNFTKRKSFHLRAIWGSILCLSMVLSPTYGTQAANEKKVALVMKALSNPFSSTMESGAKKYAQQENISLEVFGTERETDVERQIEQVRECVAKGADALVLGTRDVDEDHAGRVDEIQVRAADRIGIDAQRHRRCHIGSGRELAGLDLGDRIRVVPAP